jgi:hypothetical protein
MGVIITDLKKRWPLGFVPYECPKDDAFTEGEIEKFNSLVEWPIFQPRALHGEVPYFLIFTPVPEGVTPSAILAAIDRRRKKSLIRERDQAFIMRWHTL